MPVIDERSDQQTVKLVLHESLTVRLAENPTTGYRWSTPEYDAACIALDADDFHEAAPGAVGGGGTRVLTFSTRAPGRTSLRSVLRRPWDPASSPEGSFVLTVQVAD